MKRSVGKDETEVAFVVRRTNTGLGLFARREFAAGRRIVEYVGTVITSDAADVKGGKYLFSIDERWVIDGAARTNVARYINHSCRPNGEAFSSGRRVWIWAKRRIVSEEEITIHYGKEYFDEHIKPVGCKCASCSRRAPAK